ncbi:unnamed protein product [marine sediment metagenome]|uniref:Uncharacterized protein n=1 Tax=marine sediment metagenome TaxID=412755 RepID=X1M238_9ZZZZ
MEKRFEIEEQDIGYVIKVYENGNKEPKYLIYFPCRNNQKIEVFKIAEEFGENFVESLEKRLK